MSRGTRSPISPTAAWNEQLRYWRREIGLSRANVADRAGLSVETLKSLELGRRRPSREVLVAVLDALRVDRHARNLILASVGFNPDGLSLAPHNPEFLPSQDDMARAVSEVPWPAFVSNEMFEVVAVNQPYLAVVGIRDYFRERPEPLDRNLLAALSEPRFADRLANWDECVRFLIALMKGHHRGGESAPEQLTTYYSAVMDRFAAGDPRRVHRFLELWDGVPPQAPRSRFTYPVVWRHQDGGELRFLGLSHEVNTANGLNFHDWLPVDSETWARLQSVALPPRA